MLRHIVATVYGAAFIWIGVAHFIHPESFAAIVPPLFLFPMFWAYASGAMEIAGGIAIIAPRSRVYAGRFLALFGAHTQESNHLLPLGLCICMDCIGWLTSGWV